MEYEEIKKLMDDMGNSKLSSLDIEFPDGIKISMAKTVQNDISVVTAERITPTVVEIDGTKNKKQKEESLETITSPMVGTFYASDAPDKPAYVKVGDKVIVVLTKEKLETHLRKNEEIIWIIGANKYRHEIRPFIGLDDGNVLINYGALEQAKQLWVSYFSNGGMCYTNPNKTDKLRQAMEKRNEDLSEHILVAKLQEILRSNYSGTIDLKNVDYQRIFGQKEKTSFDV